MASLDDVAYGPPPTDADLNAFSQEYKYQEIVSATESFGSTHRLGQGTYGSVYQGEMPDGTEVAVKVLSKPNEAGFREEMEVLSKLRHPNLVTLMGFARHGKERYLVYELLPGGDVCAKLQKDPNFTWQCRLNVARDAALGLSHLHCARPRVFHRDIKSQNILLDRHLVAKMADFGLAMLAAPNETSKQVEHTSGTLGYADPLYIRTGEVTEFSEVYSFGMVLLELLTRRPPALQIGGDSRRIEYQFLHIEGELRRVKAMLDPRAGFPDRVSTGMGQLALQCIDTEDSQRPAFVEIVRTLRALIKESEKSLQTASQLQAGSIAMHGGIPLGAAQRNGPLLGAAPTPAWAAGAAVRGAGYAQQEAQPLAQRGRAFPESRVSPGAAQQEKHPLTPSQQGQCRQVSMDMPTAGSSSGQPQQERQRAPVLLASNPSATRASGSTSRPAGAADAPFLLPRHAVDSQQRRGPEGSPVGSRLHHPASSFSSVGASLYDAASAKTYAEGFVGTGAASSASATPGIIHRAQTGESGTPLTADHQRLAGASLAGQSRGQLGVIAPNEGPDELLGGIDDSPACVVDCGSAGEFVGSDTPPQGGAPPLQGGAAREWSNPRAEPAQGGKPFLLPFSAVRADAGRSLWQNQCPPSAQQPLVGDELDPLGVRSHAPEQAQDARFSQQTLETPQQTLDPSTGAQSSSGYTEQETSQRDQMMEQVTMLGFSMYQANEAFKRCSTVEGAVEWIIDPQREWAENWDP